jgi:putative transposase
LLDRVGDFSDLVDTATGEIEPQAFATLRAAETIGRPLGDEGFLARIEAQLGRSIRPGKRGRKASLAVGGEGKSKVSP